MESAATKMMRNVIEAWIVETIRSKGYERFSDLHVDQVDDAFRSRKSWIQGARECLATALVIRNEKRLPFLVAIGMSLSGGGVPQGPRFTTLEELSAQLDWSPPSLYLFEASGSPWSSDAAFQELGLDWKLAGDLLVRTLFREWYDENDGEFRRSLWATG